MKRIFLILFIMLGLVSISYAVNTTKIYKDKGGDRQVVTSGGDVLVQSGGTVTVASGGLLDIETGATFTYDDQTKDYPTFVQNIRERVTIAQLIAGEELLVAPGASNRYRVVDVFLLPYGGNCDNSTSVDIIGGTAGAVAIVKFTTTALDDDTLIRMGDTNTTPLANGAGLVSMTANTAISIASVGTNIETCEGVDVFLDYVLE